MNSKRGRPNIPRRRRTKSEHAAVVTGSVLFPLLALGILKLDTFVTDFLTTTPNMAFLFRVAEILGRYGFKQPAFNPSRNGRPSTYGYLSTIIFFIRNETPDWIKKRDWLRPWGTVESEGSYFFLHFKKIVNVFAVEVGGLHTRFSQLSMYSDTHHDNFEEDNTSDAYWEMASEKINRPKYVCKSVAAYKMNADGIKMLLKDLETTLAFYKNCEAKDFYPF